MLLSLEKRIYDTIDVTFFEGNAFYSKVAIRREKMTIDEHQPWEIIIPKYVSQSIP